MISPYAKAGYVSHTQYEFGSIIRFIEDTFDLGRLNTTDTRAASIKMSSISTSSRVHFRSFLANTRASSSSSKNRRITLWIRTSRRRGG